MSGLPQDVAQATLVMEPLAAAPVFTGDRRLHGGRYGIRDPARVPARNAPSRPPETRRSSPSQSPFSASRCSRSRSPTTTDNSRPRRVRPACSITAVAPSPEDCPRSSPRNQSGLAHNFAQPMPPRRPHPRRSKTLVPIPPLPRDRCPSRGAVEGALRALHPSKQASMPVARQDPGPLGAPLPGPRASGSGSAKVSARPQRRTIRDQRQVHPVHLPFAGLRRSVALQEALGVPEKGVEPLT